MNMTAADVDAALLEMTDAQINAALVRRAQARAARVRQQSAERMIAMRARKASGVQEEGGYAAVTPSVTQKDRNFTSGRYANSDAPVTRKQGGDLPPSPPVSPGPPSSPAPTHGERKNPARGTAEELTAYAVERGLPETDGGWLHDKMLTSGWKVDGKPVKNWQALVRVWQKGEFFPSQKVGRRSGFQGNGFSLSAPAPARARDPTPEQIAAWLATCPDYASKRGEWTTWTGLPGFARDEFLQHRKNHKPQPAQSP